MVVRELGVKEWNIKNILRIYFYYLVWKFKYAVVWELSWCEWNGQEETLNSFIFLKNSIFIFFKIRRNWKEYSFNYFSFHYLYSFHFILFFFHSFIIYLVHYIINSQPKPKYWKWMEWKIIEWVFLLIPLNFGKKKKLSFWKKWEEWVFPPHHFSPPYLTFK